MCIAEKMVNFLRNYNCIKLAKDFVMTNVEATLNFHKIDWDPLESEHESNRLCPSASNRIKRDLMNLFTDPPPGVFVVNDEQDLRIVHVLILGPSETPYEGGLFYFFVRCPSNYPMLPPKMRLMTTDGGKVRFNPNFYESGKICVSILGTWPGPSWTPISTLSSLLLTIQSMMVENPIYNEPGVNRTGTCSHSDSELYNNYIKHETIRVAVCGMVENDCRLNIPEQFKTIIEQSFLNYYDYYMDVATKNERRSGTTIKVPHFGNLHTFHYDKLIERLKKLHEKLTNTALNVD